jgi:hypothetical protein
VPVVRHFANPQRATAIVIGDYLYVDGGEVTQGDHRNLSDIRTSMPIEHVAGECSAELIDLALHRSKRNPLYSLIRNLDQLYRSDPHHR